MKFRRNLLFTLVFLLSAGAFQQLLARTTVWHNGRGCGLYYREGITQGTPQGTGWSHVPGKKAVSISVGARGHVWIVENWHEHVWFRTGVTPKNPKGTGWKRITGQGVTRLGVGKNSVWGRNKHGHIYFRDGITEAKPEGTGWTHIQSQKLGRAVWIDVNGLDQVYVHNNRNEIWARKGITKNNLKGTDWVKTPGGGFNCVHVGSVNGKPLVIGRGRRSHKRVEKLIGITPDRPEGEGWGDFDSWDWDWVSIDDEEGAIWLAAGWRNGKWLRRTDYKKIGGKQIAGRHYTFAWHIDVGNIPDPSAGEKERKMAKTIGGQLKLKKQKLTQMTKDISAKDAEIKKNKELLVKLKKQIAEESEKEKAEVEAEQKAKAAKEAQIAKINKQIETFKRKNKKLEKRIKVLKKKKTGKSKKIKKKKKKKKKKRKKAKKKKKKKRKKGKKKKKKRRKGKL